MRRRILTFILIVASCLILGYVFGKSDIDRIVKYKVLGEHNVIPKEGYIPDAETAIKVAEAIWIPIYGKEVLKEKPFRAELKNGTWLVAGSLPENYAGGVAEILISRKDGEILRVTHGK